MITMQRESLTRNFINDEAMPLLREHWVECGLYHQQIPLSVDHDYYTSSEEKGLTCCYTMRDGDRLAAYMVVSAQKHPHYKEDGFAFVDVLFVDKKYRKGMAAIRFMRYVEQEVKKTGVSVMSYHIKIHHDYPAIFERLGFNKVEVIYQKCFKE